MEKRKYSNPEQRLKKFNRALLIGGTSLSITIFIGQIIQQASNAHTKGYTIISCMLVLSSVLIPWPVYFMKPKSKVIKHLVCGLFLFYYFFTTLTDLSNNAASFYIFPLLIGSVLAYNTKFVIKYSCITFAINIIKLCLVVVQKGDILTTLLQCMIILIFVICIITVSMISDRFNKDIFGTIEDKQKLQEEMLKDVLYTANIVKKGANQVGNIVDELADSTYVMHNVLSEINEGTHMTATNIQNQTEMTQSIQIAIEDTSNFSKEMILVANQSEDAIDESMISMNQLKAQAKVIEESNIDIVETMKQLQIKTKEVEDITNVILGISNQTNMLALNASIESARAGEAGRGFAVVAEQIRKLAEETKESTGSIALLLEELKQNVSQAYIKITDSSTATVQQHDVITVAAEKFNILNNNIHLLLSDIQHIDSKVEDLSGSNNQIVESISNLSAVSEEITASSSETTKFSERNNQIIKQAKDYLKEVIETANHLDKYLNEEKNVLEA